MRISWLSLACVLAACGGPDSELPEQVGGDPGEVSSEAEAAVPAISFYQGWTNQISGSLVAGGQVRVHYENGRLRDCRGDNNNGTPAWSLTANARVNGGAVISAIVGGHTPDGTVPGDWTFTLPAEPGEIQLWFQVTNRWGCNGYDSDFGKNYRYPIAAAPTAAIAFSSDWSERVTGTLRAGGSVNIDYALDRLPNCRQGYSGFATWDILAYYRFDGGAAQYVPVTQPARSQRFSVLTPIAIPSGARRMELWFFNSDRGGCRQYDSDFGSNYRFNLR